MMNKRAWNWNGRSLNPTNELKMNDEQGLVRRGDGAAGDPSFLKLPMSSTMSDWLSGTPYDGDAASANRKDNRRGAESIESMETIRDSRLL